MSNELNELKPCPFCEGEVDRIDEAWPWGNPNHGRQSLIYVCQGCGCRLETGETFGMEYWNRRPIEDNLRACLVEAEKALAFATCIIENVEPWTDVCDSVIGEARKNAILILKKRGDEG